MDHLTKVLLIVVFLGGCNIIPQGLSDSIQSSVQGTILISEDYSRLLDKHEPEPSRTAKKAILYGWLEFQKEIYDYVQTDITEGEHNGME